MTEAPIKTKSTSEFFNEALKAIATDHAEELEHNRQLADKIGGLMSMSAKGKVAKGPLAGRVIRVSIEIDPEDEDLT